MTLSRKGFIPGCLVVTASLEPSDMYLLMTTLSGQARLDVCLPNISWHQHTLCCCHVIVIIMMFAVGTVVIVVIIIVSVGTAVIIVIVRYPFYYY